MSTLSMTSSAVRGVREEVFSLKTSFNIFLRRCESLVVKLSKGSDEYPPTHYLLDEGTGRVIYISDKLKPVAKESVEKFIAMIEKDTANYEMGLTIPNEKYPNPAWIMYKKGEGGKIVGRFTTSANDEKVATVKP